MKTPVSHIAVVIPALDEEESLPLVLAELSASGLAGATIVVDNGSTDGTAAAAAKAGATVVREPRRGYGAACLRGLSLLESLPIRPGVVVFMDADRSDDPGLIPALIRPILQGDADLVIGSRTLGSAEPGSLFRHQRMGNALYCGLIKLLFGHRYSDLGPFRAVGLDALAKLGMKDRGFGWTVEMQVKALLAGLRVAEIPVGYRRRVGRSKISGTLMGSARAGLKIGWTILRLRLAA